MNELSRMNRARNRAHCHPAQLVPYRLPIATIRPVYAILSWPADFFAAPRTAQRSSPVGRRSRSVRRCRACSETAFSNLAHRHPTPLTHSSSPPRTEADARARVRYGTTARPRTRALVFLTFFFSPAARDAIGLSVDRPRLSGFSTTRVERSSVGHRVECSQKFPRSRSRGGVSCVVVSPTVVVQQFFFFFWVPTTSHGNVPRLDHNRAGHAHPAEALAVASCVPRLGARRLAASVVARKRLHRNLGRVPWPPVVAHRGPRCRP